MAIESLPPLRLRRRDASERTSLGWRLLWCGVALLAVGVTVISQYPAAWAAERVASATGQRVLLADPQGSIWHGSATLALTALLFRLGLERRAGEIGVLKAIGYRDSHVRNLFLAEGAVVALGGACVGALASMAYTPALLAYLAATWPDASLGRVLKPAFDPVAMGLGGLMAFAAGIVSIIFSMRDLVKMQPLALLRGGTRQLDESVLKRPRAGWVGSVGVLLAGTALAACSPMLPPGEPRSGGFFTAGLLFLTAGILALRAALRVVLRLPLRATNAWPLAMLAARNAARRPARSLVTAGLRSALQGIDASFQFTNRGKQSVTIDLKAPEGRAIFHKLVARADVFIENFRPGVARKLGIAYEQLAADHPRLVYCSISGFGSTGPYAGHPSYDSVAQALSTLGPLPQYLFMISVRSCISAPICSSLRYTDRRSLTRHSLSNPVSGKTVRSSFCMCCGVINIWLLSNLVGM